MDYKFVNSILSTMDKMYLRVYDGRYVQESFKVQYLTYDNETKRVQFTVLPCPSNTDYLSDFQAIEIDISEITFEKINDEIGIRIEGLEFYMI